MAVRLYDNNSPPATSTWNGALDGDWTDRLAWTPNVPAANGIAVFNNSASTNYTATIAPGIQVGDVIVASDLVTFDLSTAPTANTSGSSLTISRTLSVGRPVQLERTDDGLADAGQFQRLGVQHRSGRVGRRRWQQRHRVAGRRAEQRP